MALLLINGVPQTGDVPSVSSFLQSTSGAYTTTRTHHTASSSCVLFWHRHLSRLSQSLRILSLIRPHLLGPAPPPPPSHFSSVAPSLDLSLALGLRLACHRRAQCGLTDELALTALVRTNHAAAGSSFHVFLHIGFYAPPVFGSAGARLAVAGPGRDLASAKYSDWVRLGGSFRYCSLYFIYFLFHYYIFLYLQPQKY
jgi:hypothetical protein